MSLFRLVVSVCLVSLVLELPNTVEAGRTGAFRVRRMARSHTKQQLQLQASATVTNETHTDGKPAPTQTPSTPSKAATPATPTSSATSTPSSASPAKSSMNPYFTEEQLKTMDSYGITDIRRSCEGWGVKEALEMASKKMEGAKAWADAVEKAGALSPGKQYLAWFFQKAVSVTYIKTAFDKMHTKLMVHNLYPDQRYNRMRVSCYDDSKLPDTDPIKKACSKDTYAFVEPSERTGLDGLGELEINLCAAFKELALDGKPLSPDFKGKDDPKHRLVCPPGGTCMNINSKWGTIVHELSHFKTTIGTDDVDKSYGLAECRKLTNRSPHDAKKNAEHYQLFLEAAGGDLPK